MDAQKYNYGKFINKDTIPYYANTNEEHLKGDVKGIVIEFPGLGGGSCLGGLMEQASYSNKEAIWFGEKGILIAYLFPGPWSWGNKGATRMADAVVAALADKYNLPEGFPLAVCGGSMGGTGALMYAADTSYKLRMAAIACPCIDVIARLECHESFPRTYVSAVACYEMELEEALKSISPMHRIEDMQKTKYFICSDAQDEIFPEEECNLYVEKLIKAGHDVEYHRQSGQPHGGFFPEIRLKLHKEIENAILNV